MDHDRHSGSLSEATSDVIVSPMSNKKEIEVKGFLKKPRLTAAGNLSRGRFTCDDVQWTGEKGDILATFTITAEELADAAESGLLWTDQDVQRGIKPDVFPQPRRELSVGDGYPNENLYIFNVANADDIAEKLLRGDRLFLTPLVWNLRPGEFEAFWDNAAKSLYLYTGKFYLPDSHHRQQGILKAVRQYREAKGDFPKFSPTKQFKVELYFLSKEDEGNYFFDKNQRPRPTAKSKAYDLTTEDDLSLLAKKVIEKSTSLQQNVNRVTDRLTPRNPQVITLSTLREMMKSLAVADSLDAVQIEGIAKSAAAFYDLLATVRPELSLLTANERRVVREQLVVDAAVMMQGYAGLMKDFNAAIPQLGMEGAKRQWLEKLEQLSSNKVYSFGGQWGGDFFEKNNPLWQHVGVVKPGIDGSKLTVLNTGAARSQCMRVLRQIVAAEAHVRNLEFLAAG